MKNSKSLILSGLLYLVPILFSFGNSDVYICKGPASKKYHYKKDCRGLSNCSTKIYTVSISEAKELGRTLNGWED